PGRLDHRRLAQPEGVEEVFRAAQGRQLRHRRRPHRARALAHQPRRAGGIKPKVVVLMIGTNNTGSKNAGQITAGVKTIVDKLEELSPDTKILLLGVFPRGPEPNTKVREKISRINQDIAKLDDGKRVKYMDIGAKFTKDDGKLTKDVMPDYLHLSPRGY